MRPKPEASRQKRAETSRISPSSPFTVSFAPLPSLEKPVTESPNETFAPRFCAALINRSSKISRRT